MMADHADDDPFERAARRERRQAVLAEHTSYEDWTSAPAMVGMTAAWAVLLWLHAYLGDTDSRLFRIHFVVFVLFAAIAVGVLVQAVAARLLTPHKRG